MSIESPSALWLALALPPILVLWMLRPRRVRQRVSSLLLWRGSEVERRSARPWQRLRSHPLLWLQLLVALLLVAAAVRPFLPAATEARHIVVLLDASGSMRATDVAPNRFAAAREAVRDIASSLGPDQRLTLIRLDETPRVLSTAVPGEAAAIERVLAAQEPSYGTADLAAALALAEGIAQDAEEWLLVSDGVLDVPAGSLLPDGVSLHTRLVAPARAAGNIAVTGIRVRVDGDRVSVQAAVRNTGREPVAGRLVLLAETEVTGAREWTLDPGEERHVTWSGLAAGPRWFEARLADVPNAANALPNDDHAWAGVPAEPERRVLLVSDGNIFLERILAVLSGIRASRAGTAAWAAIAASEEPYDVIIFDGVWPDVGDGVGRSRGRSPPTAPRAADVGEGAVGEGVERPWSRGNLLVVGPPSRESFSPERIQPAPAHPLVRHVDWSDVSIAAGARLPDADGWEAVVNSSGGPLLAVRESGGRREAALAFRLEHSDLPLRPAFPVLMANLLDWLAPRSAGEPLMTTPGAPVRIDPAPLAETVRVQDRGGAIHELAPPWPPAVFRPPVPGVYRVIQEGPAGRHDRLVIAAGYAASEASLAPRPLSIARTDGGRGRRALLAAWSLWPLLALAVVAASLVEWWVDARGR